MEPSQTSQTPQLSAVDAMLLEAEGQLNAQNSNGHPVYEEGAGMRVLANGAVEETSPLFNDEGTRLEFVNEAALKHYRDLVQLLDHANNAESRNQGSTPQTTSTMVNTKVTMSSTTQNHVTVIIESKKGNS